MAPSLGRATLIFPVNLGAASEYDEDIFPRAYHNAGDPISKGSLLLTATLDEIIKMAELGIDLNTDNRFHFNARAEYEALTAKEAKLQNRPKSANIITKFRHYRAARMFHAASKDLFRDTKRTSERIQREERLIRAVPSTELSAMDETAPQDAMITGIAIELAGPLDDNAHQTMLAATNAFALRASASDPFISIRHLSQPSDDDSIFSLPDTASLLTQDPPSEDPQDSESTAAGSSSIHFHVYNPVFATGSNFHGVTLNHGSGNSGSAAVQQPPS